MAKKKTSSSNKQVTLSKSFFAFWGIVLAAAAVLFGFIFGKIGGGLTIVSTILNLIGQIAIAIAIVPSAWAHVAHKNVAWKIIFFVALAIYIVFIVLGAVL